MSVTRYDASMNEKRSVAGPIAVAALLVVVPLGAYVGGYFLLGKWEDWTSFGRVQTVRIFPHYMIARLYKPLADLESAVTGIPVSVLVKDSDRRPRPIQ
jgi:hypothetical protein